MDPQSDNRNLLLQELGKLKRRKRTTKEQLVVLENVFIETSRPRIQDMKNLALKYGMTTRSVQVWFQNRRAKHKRQKNYRITDSAEDKDHSWNDGMHLASVRESTVNLPPLNLDTCNFLQQKACDTETSYDQNIYETKFGKCESDE